MKLFFHKKNNIFLLLIYLYFIQISSENEEKQLERIKNAINLILTRANGIIDKDSLTFEYEKYNITLKNSKILKLFNKNLTITKEVNDKNETFFNISNIVTTIQCDIIIQLFSQKKEIIKYKSIFFELYFNEIKFKLINNYKIEFSSSNVESINYINVENLDYFSDFNNKKVCIFYEDEKEPILLEDMDSKLIEIFQNKFEEKIKEKQNKINLFTYDMIQIFDNYHYKININDYSEFIYIFFLEPQKFQVEENDINLDLEKNSISIKYFTLKGVYVYYLLPYMYFNFVMKCQKDKKQFIYERNENGTKLEFILSDCSITDDNYQFQTESLNYNAEIIKILENYYIDYLKESVENYYKDIFE